MVAGEDGCEAHPLAGRQAGRRCPLCRREQIVAAAAAAVPGMAPLAVRAAVNAVATSPQAVRDLAAALSAGPDALQLGAPPVVGRLVSELR